MTRTLLILMLAMMPVTAFLHAESGLPASTETPAERDARMAWWREAKFGMFIHWGVYAIPAGTYKGMQVNPRMDPKTLYFSEWLQNRFRIPVAEYADYAKQFNPREFDGDKWVRLAADAGMKYIVITAKHHDGFAMFKSPASPFNIVDASPFKRDVIRELAEACAKHNMKFGVYYSQAQDWHHPGALLWHGPWDEAQAGDMDDYLDRIAIPQIRELLTNYGRISILWFDTPQVVNPSKLAKGTLGITPDRARRVLETLKLQPGIIINNRLGGGIPGDTGTPEGFVPNQMPKGDWETCMTMNDSWGFKNGDNNWKSTGTLLRNLIDIVSKGGNYPLNVGPNCDGVIPRPEVERLETIGRWLKVNGEAIYGAGPTPFGAEIGHYSNTEKDKSGKPAFITTWDWRATTKPGKIYLIVFNWPADGRFLLPSLKQKVRNAYLLADPKHANLKSVWSGDGLMVSLPNAAPDAIASVICLELDE
jgi:alpha-L-fucosidase